MFNFLLLHSKSREDRKKQRELKEARKAGRAPAEVDEDGNEINPHIPPCIAIAPWYSEAGNGLKLQRIMKRTLETNCTKSANDRGVTIFQAETYRKDACDNCGAMTHNARDETRKKLLKKQPKKLKGKNNNQNREGDEEVEEGDNDGDLRVDETKADESKQMDFAKVEKRLRTTRGGSTGTVRNLLIREGTAKYLRNLDVNSAYYDPKTRSMCEDPLPVTDPNEKFYGGDNQYRNSGQALEFKQLDTHAREAFDMGHDIHMQAGPSQAELLYKNYKVTKEKLKSRTKAMISEKYGNAASEEEITPRELLLRQMERRSGI
ncbi:hypothetical protein TIFTF001_018134 [Ficus carica]|uniref:Pre-mRNA-splicing factor SLU7 n=1 Tax=Ficus carica TaxID=3494 RepID=A0AA88A3N7_FICCA|nr:hypothetical protein TIFTF001_018134 [Ficus carica]